MKYSCSSLSSLTGAIKVFFNLWLTLLHGLDVLLHKSGLDLRCPSAVFVLQRPPPHQPPFERAILSTLSVDSFLALVSHLCVFFLQQIWLTCSRKKSGYVKLKVIRFILKNAVTDCEVINPVLRPHQQNNQSKAVY